LQIKLKSSRQDGMPVSTTSLNMVKEEEVEEQEEA
jgi:twitching motility protein PilU